MVRYCNVSSFHTVTIYNYSYPIFLHRPIKHETYGNKKAWEILTSRLSLISGLRIAPTENATTPRQ